MPVRIIRTSPKTPGIDKNKVIKALVKKYLAELEGPNARLVPGWLRGASNVGDRKSLMNLELRELAQWAQRIVNERS
jgi:hypothetical protein